MKKHLEVPIFNTEYKVLVCWFDWEAESGKIVSYLEGYHHNIGRLTAEVNFGENSKRRAVTFYTKGCHPAIVLRRFPKTPTEIGSLAHEATHAVSYIFNSLDERVTDHETYAMSVGAVVREVLGDK